MKQFLFAVLALSSSFRPSRWRIPATTELMGTISSIDKNKIVKTTEGKDMTFEVVPTTTFKVGAKKGTQTDLKVGMRIVVSATEEGTR
jgi:hypothetical protein